MSEFNEFQSYIRNVASPCTSKHIHTHMQCPHFQKKTFESETYITIDFDLNQSRSVASISVFWDLEMNARSVIINRVSINSLG